MVTQAFIALVSAVLGGCVAHYLTSLRDRANKRREKKVDYLVQAYRRLEACAHHHWSKNDRTAVAEFEAVMSELRSALADIQLFGSRSQVKLAQDFAREFADRRSASFDELLEDLRRDLRSELSLEEVPLGMVHLRFRRDEQRSA